MKKMIPFLVMALVGFTSSFGQSKEVRSVGTFTKISFRVPGKLVVRQGSPQKVEIEGDKATLSKIETEVKGDRLVIGNEEKWNWGWRDTERIMVYITVKDITGLSVSGSGELITEGRINTDQMDLNVSGSGSLQTDVNATGEVEANVSGSGRIDVKGNCRSSESDLSGSGRVFASLTI